MGEDKNRPFSAIPRVNAVRVVVHANNDFVPQVEDDVTVALKETVVEVQVCPMCQKRHLYEDSGQDQDLVLPCVLYRNQKFRVMKVF